MLISADGENVAPVSRAPGSNLRNLQPLLSGTPPEGLDTQGWPLRSGCLSAAGFAALALSGSRLRVTR